MYYGGMGINLSTIKQELRELRDERERVDKKIAALEKTEDAYRSERIASKSSTNGKSARGINIRPIISSIFEKNGNNPLQVKQIVEEIEKVSELSQEMIRKKIVYAVRPTVGLLVKTEYGKYQMKK